VDAAIRTKGLEVKFGDSVALSGVNLDVPVGSSLAVIGPNGSGKSTLLGVLAGTIEPTAGQAIVSGPRPALVLQSTDVDPSLPITVREAVSLARYPALGLFRRFRPSDRGAVDNALKRLAVDDLQSRQLNELSGGQRQRVLIAQGLAQNSDVLLLDEPVNGLDVTSRSIILDVIEDEVEAGKTVVVTTHNLDDARRCDQVLLVNTDLIAIGPPSMVLNERHLHQAFGGRFMRVGNELLLDDPHHSH